MSLLLLTSWAQAEEPSIDAQTIEICNRAIKTIYQDILRVKDRYPELNTFDSTALSQNQYGLYVISYENPEFPSIFKNNHYKFGLTIVPTKEIPYKDPTADIIAYNYTILGVKFAAFQTRGVRGKHYDLTLAVQKFGQPIYNHQQKYIPLQLILQSEKSVYNTNERVKFRVTLMNSGSQNLRVKNLGENSLFFTIDNKVWGTQPDLSKPGESKEVTLYPGGSISRGFAGDSFTVPREIEIMGTYNMAYKGVLPMGSIKIKVVR